MGLKSPPTTKFMIRVLNECARLGLIKGREPSWQIAIKGSGVWITLVNGCKFQVSNHRYPVNGLGLLEVIAQSDTDLSKAIYDPNHPMWDIINM